MTHGHQFLDLPGGHSLGYKTWGEPDDPSVLLIGGYGEPVVGWELSGLVEALVADGRHVIAYAARGVAPSDVPALPWSVDDLADDGFALLDGLGVDRCDLVGYSLGGFTAEAMVRRAPERFGRAVWMASAGAPSALTVVLARAEVSLSERFGEIPHEFRTLLTTLTSLPYDDLVGEQGRGWLEVLEASPELWTSPQGERGQAQAARGWLVDYPEQPVPLPDGVGRITALTFAYDCLLPPVHARPYAEALGIAYVEIPDAAHGGLLTHPEPTIAAIRSALR